MGKAFLCAPWRRPVDHENAERRVRPGRCAVDGPQITICKCGIGASVMEVVMSNGLIAKLVGSREPIAQGAVAPCDPSACPFGQMP